MALGWLWVASVALGSKTLSQEGEFRLIMRIAGRIDHRREHLDTTAGRSGPKSETRNPKPETNSNAQWSKAKNRQQGSGLGHSLLGAWGLFRASGFGFRVSTLWLAVVPRCAQSPVAPHASSPLPQPVWLMQLGLQRQRSPERYRARALGLPGLADLLRTRCRIFPT